jgi:hypothetical protein
MKRPNITPGPWKENEHGRILANGDTLLIQGVALPHYTTPEIEANTKAVKAVPKLLAILEQMAECQFSAENCASLEVARARIQSLARLGLKEAGYTFD